VRARYEHERLMDWFLERTPSYRQDALERQRQADGLVVWLVGLSSAAIALILSGKGTLGSISPLALKLAVGTAFLTIVCAVLFRVFSYGLGQVESGLMEGFLSFCSAYRSTRHGPIEINENYSVEQIAERLKEDMGLNYDHWLGKGYLDRDFWLDMYKGFAKLWREQEAEGDRLLIKALAPLIGKDPEEIAAAGRDEEGTMRLSRKANRFRKVCNWSFVLMTVFFVLSVAAVAVGFIPQ